MKIIYSDHTIKRMRQRGITELEIEHVLIHPDVMKKSLDGRKEAIGHVRNRKVKVVFIETESYIRIISVI